MNSIKKNPIENPLFSYSFDLYTKPLKLMSLIFMIQIQPTKANTLIQIMIFMKSILYMLDFSFK